MSPKTELSIKDLPPEARRKVLERAGRKRAPAQRSFPAEHVRRHALKVCALVAELTQDQRRRVLAHALKINAV